MTFVSPGTLAYSAVCWGYGGPLNFGFHAFPLLCCRGRTGLGCCLDVSKGALQMRPPPQYTPCSGGDGGTTAALLRGRCPLDRSQSSLPPRLLAPALCLRQSARIAGRAEARQRGGYGRAVGSSGWGLSSPARCFQPHPLCRWPYTRGSRTIRPVFVREPGGTEGVQSQNRPFLLPKGRSARGFSRKIGLFCYRRVGQQGGSVAKSGFFATEG